MIITRAHLIKRANHIFKNRWGGYNSKAGVFTSGNYCFDYPLKGISLCEVINGGGGLYEVFYAKDNATMLAFLKGIEHGRVNHADK